jgi:prepilin-type N-terminal cleavage/methylation domain-containing protein/prepilin-type processing-associated H-X9-DG protein
MPISHKIRAFTLIELLVVISILTVLFALLLPTITAARVTARTAVCGTQMRQQAVMVGQYAADSKGFLPCPTSEHRLSRTISTGSGGIQAYPSSDLYLMTLASTPCPDGYPSTVPKGWGWFYFQGYLPPTTSKTTGSVTTSVRRPLSILQCPGTPPIVYRGSILYGKSWVDWEESTYQQFSKILRALSLRDTTVSTNPQGVGASYDCYQGDVLVSYSDYMNRGWMLTSGLRYTARIDNWKPGNAWAVDNEGWMVGGLPSSTDPQVGWMRKHTEGINVMFIDGHVKFTGKDVSVATAGGNISVPPAVYYSMSSSIGTAQTLANAYSGSNAGWANGGGGLDTKIPTLWAHYETVP